MKIWQNGFLTVLRQRKKKRLNDVVSTQGFLSLLRKQVQQWHIHRPASLDSDRRQGQSDQKGAVCSRLTVEEEICLFYTGWSKSLCASDDYSTNNTQKYIKQSQSLTMIT
jgi:hypothetical protein